MKCTDEHPEDTIDSPGANLADSHTDRVPQANNILRQRIHAPPKQGASRDLHTSRKKEDNSRDDDRDEVLSSHLVAVRDVRSVHHAVSK